MSILQEQERFFNMMTRLIGSNSKAASSGIEKDDVVVTEVINGVITSRPAKKTTYLNDKDNESEPEIIELTRSKTASVPLNKLQTIIRFQRSNGRL